MVAAGGSDGLLQWNGCLDRDSPWVSDTATADQPQHNGNNSDDQQNVNQATQGVGSQQAQQPQNNQ